MSTPTHTTLINASICPCGFRAVNDDIKLGTPYVVHFDNVGSFTWVCGGCGQEQQIVGVFVEHPTNPGYLPLALFDQNPVKVFAA